MPSSSEDGYDALSALDTHMNDESRALGFGRFGSSTRPPVNTRTKLLISNCDSSIFFDGHTQTPLHAQVFDPLCPSRHHPLITGVLASYFH
jgi:hypothetical protein